MNIILEERKLTSLKKALKEKKLLKQSSSNHAGQLILNEEDTRTPEKEYTKYNQNSQDRGIHFSLKWAKKEGNVRLFQKQDLGDGNMHRTEQKIQQDGDVGFSEKWLLSNGNLNHNKHWKVKDNDNSLLQETNSGLPSRQKRSIKNDDDSLPEYLLMILSTTLDKTRPIVQVQQHIDDPSIDVSEN